MNVNRCLPPIHVSDSTHFTIHRKVFRSKQIFLKYWFLSDILSFNWGGLDTFQIFDSTPQFHKKKLIKVSMDLLMQSLHHFSVCQLRPRDMHPHAFLWPFKLNSSSVIIIGLLCSTRYYIYVADTHLVSAKWRAQTLKWLR